jgi:hypothetical protein
LQQFAINPIAAKIVITIFDQVAAGQIHTNAIIAIGIIPWQQHLHHFVEHASAFSICFFIFTSFFV